MMTHDRDRLTAANPLSDEAATTLDLTAAESEMLDRISGDATRASARRRRRVPGSRAARALGPWSAAAATAAVAVVLLIIGFLSSSAPNRAQAFPVLGAQTALTPASLQKALLIYGVGPDNAGLNIRQGRPFPTPWGTGYVLTNHDRSIVCAVAPGTGSHNWGASCARTETATHEGTAAFEYSYDKPTNTARFLTLLPAGATATAQPQGQARSTIPLHNGVLAFVVHRRTVITTHIANRTRVTHLSPSGASLSADPVTTRSRSDTTSSASASRPPSSP